MVTWHLVNIVSGNGLLPFLSQCWLIIKRVLGHSPESNFTRWRSTHELNPWYVFNIGSALKLQHIPGVNELNFAWYISNFQQLALDMLIAYYKAWISAGTVMTKSESRICIFSKMVDEILQNLAEFQKQTPMMLSRVNVQMRTYDWKYNSNV